MSQDDNTQETLYEITMLEIIEGLVFTMIGISAIFIVKDKPKRAPSFIATQKDMSLAA